MKETFKIGNRTYSADIHKEGKNYVATCVEVGISDFGDTQKIALQNLIETMQEHLRAFPMQKGVKRIYKKIGFTIVFILFPITMMIKELLM